jgi:hypothetical protein
MKSCLLKISKLVVISALFLNPFIQNRIHAQTNEINLKGEWLLKLQPLSTEDKELWLSSSFNSKINLPGTLDDYGFGVKVNPDTIKDPYRTLMRKYKYIGKARYQKEVNIPEDWQNKRIILTLERVIWKSEVWIDGKRAGTDESLCTPHKYNLTKFLLPGKHVITICIDNSRQHYIGLGPADFSHAYTEQTQIIWNGILGEIKLEASDLFYIDDLQIYPDALKKSAEVVVTVKNDNVKSAEGELSVTAVPQKGGDKTSAKDKIMVEPGKSKTVKLKIQLGDNTILWDEFTPDLYKMIAQLKNGNVTDEKTYSFGLREFKTKGNKFIVNGSTIFLRGTLECATFPKTGYPPTKTEEWLKIYEAAKAYGLNHLRFHSWCPPRAAFDAADRMGFYLQVELPWWVQDVGKRKERDDFIKREADKIINAYGNHPSFCLFSMGNELEGDYDFLHNLVEYLKSKDPRHLYTSTTFSFQGEHGKMPEMVDEFFITQQSKMGWIRGQGIFNANRPENTSDYRNSIDGILIPVISHEIGQYSVYPNLKEIEKYTGVIYPNNFVKIKQHLEKKGLLDQAADFTKASGKLAYYLYKEEIERALRTPNQAGFQLLQLYDFPGQGTALVGLLDAFWESKGIIEPDEFRKFTAPVVPLLRMEKFSFKNNEVFKGDIEFANYSSSLINNSDIFWRITYKNETIAEGVFNHIELSKGKNTKVGQIVFPLDKINEAAQLKVIVGLSGKDIVNDWDIWIYPETVPEISEKKNDVVITSKIETVIEALNASKNVLFIPVPGAIINKESGRFVPVFWSPVHFPNQAASMGLLVNPGHPALEDFPTDFCTNWQWWDLTHQMSAMNINEFPQKLRPIVQVIDDFVNNNKLALIYEVKAGSGKLLVCSADLLNDLGRRPEASQLKFSLINYANSPRFNPNAEVSMDFLKSQFKSVPLMNKRVIYYDSQAAGCEAANALDDNPNTIWHTPWTDPNVKHPHEIVIDLGEEINITGLKILPRQDNNKNGWIEEYEIYITKDSNVWGEPSAKGKFDFSSEEKIVQLCDEKNKPLNCRYIKLKALSGFVNDPYTSIAEIGFLLN